jgi:hypothetical protein
MYILIYSGNWNEEIEVDGFVIINNKTKTKIEKLLKRYKETIYLNFGEEELEYENGNELLDEISFLEINDDEIKTINKFFGRYNDFGYNLISILNKTFDIELLVI